MDKLRQHIEQITPTNPDSSQVNNKQDLIRNA